MNESILIVKQEQVVTITLNRIDKRNALTGEMIAELLQHLMALKKDKTIRVLILRANGKDFCAGADVNWMLSMSQASPDENYAHSQMLADLLFELYHFPIPTIALAQGAVRGGGLGLLSAVDIAMSTPDASFAFPEVKMGLTPSTISPYVITAIGERFAHYYFLTGERFDAHDAYRLGLIHRIVAEDEMHAACVTLVQELLANSPHALMEAKLLIRRVAREKISENLVQQTAEHLSEIRNSKDAKEGLKAFLEKRTPTWS